MKPVITLAGAALAVGALSLGGVAPASSAPAQPLTGVVIALDPGHQLDVAVKRPWVGHELQVLLLPDIGQRQFGPLGVAQLVPGVQAGLVQPGVERGQIGPASLGRLAPGLHDAMGERRH